MAPHRARLVQRHALNTRRNTAQPSTTFCSPLTCYRLTTNVPGGKRAPSLTRLSPEAKLCMRCVPSKLRGSS